MSERTPVQEVFTEVEADPDAILERVDADSLAELIAGGGRHDPDADDTDADESVADLLGNLQDAAIETTDSSDDGRERAAEHERDGSGARDTDRKDREQAADRPTTSTADSSSATEAASGGLSAEAVTFGEPSVEILPGDGDAIDELLDSGPTPDEPTADMELVGSPTVTRVSSDAFGSC